MLSGRHTSAGDDLGLTLNPRLNISNHELGVLEQWSTAQSTSPNLQPVAFNRVGVGNNQTVNSGIDSRFGKCENF